MYLNYYAITNTPASDTVNLYSVPLGDFIVIPPPATTVSNSLTETVLALVAVTPAPNATASVTSLHTAPVPIAILLCVPVPNILMLVPIPIGSPPLVFPPEPIVIGL